MGARGGHGRHWRQGRRLCLSLRNVRQGPARPLGEGAWLTSEDSKAKSPHHTEMMNGGRQQLDSEAHQRELDLVRRAEALEEVAEHLEQSLTQRD